MADEPRMAMLNPALSRRLMSAGPEVEARLVALSEFQPEPANFVLRPPPPQPGPALAPPPAPPPQPLTPPPEAPTADPFAELPYPSPGDRIKAEDFRRLAQALRIVADAYALGGALFGLPYAVAAATLAAQGYEVARVMSATGAELGGPGAPAPDERRVIGVAPVHLGGPQVNVVVTDVAQPADRRMPSLLGLSYRQAQARLQSEVGDLLAGAGPIAAPQLVGRTVAEAQRGLTGATPPRDTTIRTGART